MTRSIQRQSSSGIPSGLPCSDASPRDFAGCPFKPSAVADFGSRGDIFDPGLTVPFENVVNTPVALALPAPKPTVGFGVAGKEYR